MYLRYYLNEKGERVYTMNKMGPQMQATTSAHPAEMSDFEMEKLLGPRNSENEASENDGAEESRRVLDKCYRFGVIGDGNESGEASGGTGLEKTGVVPPDVEPQLSEEFLSKISPEALNTADSVRKDYVCWQKSKAESGAISLKERETLYSRIYESDPTTHFAHFEELMSNNYPIPEFINGSHLVCHLNDTALCKTIKMFFTMRTLSSELHVCTGCHDCEICTAPAIGKHYNSYVCGGCRMFFKRMTLAKQLIPMLTCINGNDNCYDGEGAPAIKNCDKCRYCKCIHFAKMDERSVVPEDGDDFTVLIPEPTESRANKEFIENVYSSFIASLEACEEKPLAQTFDIQGSHLDHRAIGSFDPMMEFSDSALARIAQFADGILEFGLMDIESQSIALALSCLELMIIRCARQCIERDITFKKSPNIGDLDYELFCQLPEMHSFVIATCKFIRSINLPPLAIVLLQAVCLFSSTRMGVPSALMVKRICPLLQSHGIKARRFLYEIILDANDGNHQETTVTITNLLEMLISLELDCWEMRDLEDFNLANYSDA